MEAAGKIVSIRSTDRCRMEFPGVSPQRQTLRVLRVSVVNQCIGLLLAVMAVAGCRTGRNYVTPEGPRYVGVPGASQGASRADTDTLRVASFNIEFAQQVNGLPHLFQVNFTPVTIFKVRLKLRTQSWRKRILQVFSHQFNKFLAGKLIIAHA